MQFVKKAILICLLLSVNPLINYAQQYNIQPQTFQDNEMDPASPEFMRKHYAVTDQMIIKYHQKPHNARKTKEKSNKTVTSIEYEFSSLSDSIPSHKNYEIYDEQGNRTNWITYSWSENEGDWIKEWYWKTTYNELGNFKLILRF